MAHTKISSVAEPWLLLPLCYTVKERGVLTEYSHFTAFNAISDFVNNLPNRDADYFSALNKFVTSLYEKQCQHGELYFLDKTPRYHFIIDEISKIFPDAKFIFLFRNPVHVMSSIIQTWGKGRIKLLYQFQQDLVQGPINLSKGYKKLENRSLKIKYEDFVGNPEAHLKKICEYLEIKHEEQMLTEFTNSSTKGRMGDPTGVKAYNAVTSTSLDKWKQTFDGVFRKPFIRSYINRMDNDILDIQGYSKNQILSDINQLNTKRHSALQDIIDYIYFKLVQFFKPNIWLGKNTRFWARKYYLR